MTSCAIINGEAFLDRALALSPTKLRDASTVSSAMSCAASPAHARSGSASACRAVMATGKPNVPLSSTVTCRDSGALLHKLRDKGLVKAVNVDFFELQFCDVNDENSQPGVRAM